MPKILIIDDDRTILAIFEKIFRREGYEVAVASDGKRGIKKFEQQHPDVVVTDIIMPDMEGLETIRHIRKIAPAVGILAISGGGYNPAEPYLKNALMLGADSTMKKPCKVQQLIAEVGRLTVTRDG